MAKCETCAGDVVMALTDRGRQVPVEPGHAGFSTLAVYADPGTRTIRARYVRDDDGLRDGEVFVKAHWDVSPGCRPARPRGRRAGQKKVKETSK